MSQPPFEAASPGPRPAHDNGFGLLRLVFASLVILAHVPEIHDGNNSREILFQIFGSLSFGGLAVDGFFLISGALITASWLAASSWRAFLWRRIIRIYPGFLVAFAVSVLIVAPLGGAVWHGLPGAARVALQGVFLQPPDVGPVFEGQHYGLNGSMWTIFVEFGCYLMLMGLGLAGLVRRRGVMLALCLVCAVMFVRSHYLAQAWIAAHPPVLVLPVDRAAHGPDIWGTVQGLWRMRPNWRLVFLFLAGANFHLWRDVIAWRGDLALGALAGLLAGLFLPLPWAEIAVALFGGYLVFYLARAARGTPWARINAGNDISYGVYLYAWPVQKLWMWYLPGLSIWTYGGLTFAGAVACGWASWLWIEAPALRFGRRFL